MERRVLIVEHDSEFALSMASVLKGVGYQTSVAEDGSAALRELEKRRPDLVVLRAELPDQSGFVLCGQIKKSQSGSGVAILLLSSEVDRDGMTQHAQSPSGVEGYLSIPFEMPALIEMATRLAPRTEESVPTDEDKEMEASLDSALVLNDSRPKEQAPPTPPPIRSLAPGVPPRLPKRERRSAMTEEDRAFLDRAFQSIADRKAELLAESRQVRRNPPRREMMGTPEAKVQILREELKLRESQIARLSEIWAVRERELLSVEDRVHEKDVELQGLKMQVDDLVRRVNDAQQTALIKEKEHGATVDDLLFQKFATEKDLIEVVASKEKDINTLRKEISGRDGELTHRANELEFSRKEYAKLEKQLGVTTLEFEVKEQALNSAIQERDAELTSVRAELEKLRGDFANAVAEKDRKISDLEKVFQQKSDELLSAHQERDATVRGLEARLGAADAHLTQSDAEIQRLLNERAEAEKKHAAQVTEYETQVAELRGQRDDFRIQRDGLAQTMTDRLAQRDSKIAQLGQEMTELHTRKEQQEAALAGQIQGHLERIGGLEGEVEAAQAQLVDREAELQAQMSERERELQGAFAAREQGSRERWEAQEKHLREEMGKAHEARQHLEVALNEQVATSEKQIADLNQRNSGLGQQLNEARTAIADLEKRLQQMRVELEKTMQERTVREGELKTTRNEIGRITGILRQTDEAKASMERALTSEIDALKSQVAQIQADAQDLSEQLSETKNELGDRVAEVTQLSSQFSQAEDARQDAEERLQALAEDLERREALLQNDLAAKNKDLSDLQHKLVQQTQERQRQVEALTREVSVKTEQIKQAEAKQRVAGDQAHRREEELAQRLASLSNELDAERSNLGEQLQVAQKAQAKAIAERDQVRSTLTSQVNQATAKAQELANLLQQTRAESKRLQEDLQGKLNRADARITQLTQEFQGRGAKAEQDAKDALQQLTVRSRKIQELEKAVETAHSAKIRLEKELTARLVAGDSNLNEGNARIAALLKERKEVEGRHLREVEEINAKHKAELERRDSVKSQETARLQQAVLEKSKALKVIELELARYKNKASAAAPRSSAPPTTGGTSKPTNTIVPDRPAPTGIRPVTTPPPPRAGNGNSAAARQPIRPAAIPVAADDNSLSESTLVLQIDEDTVDWNSVVDDLEK